MVSLVGAAVTPLAHRALPNQNEEHRRGRAHRQLNQITSHPDVSIGGGENVLPGLCARSEPRGGPGGYQVPDPSQLEK